MGEGGEEKVLQFSPSFSLPSFSFPPETPDTKAKEGDNLCTLLQSVCCLFHAKSVVYRTAKTAMFCIAN